MTIGNDKEFKAALAALDPSRQRQVAARFVESVLGLCGDVRVAGAVQAAKRPDITDVELAALYQAAKSASVETYTQCGRETDWAAQAGHFVCKAAVNCVKPAVAHDILAWDAAMEARMARTCASIASGGGTETREAETQYGLLESFLSA
ncbi:hypothetical protein EZJ19_14445 [Parasulfuritortus cantonensis]|uniref:Uncharacterized protein n=1 Tax=Parasulfuritortus cantonensis TaxID=2528202 RepID=A0A4R1B1F1_9PROT|nr:hypothetical protein [Parasulfuritortus cantonensis]TCJ11852.1 hypothetical protein EZJ19_14445 [Parasulfuritortus cantonensis]